MTEIRKAIIELIEPFMDKTLSEGCLIIGHYDITAVLKYIESKKGYIRFINGTIRIEYGDSSEDENGELCVNIIGTISNKPLHLFTELEEKDLLNLLTTLK